MSHDVAATDPSAAGEQQHFLVSLESPVGYAATATPPRRTCSACSSPCLLEGSTARPSAAELASQVSSAVDLRSAALTKSRRPSAPAPDTAHRLSSRYRAAQAAAAAIVAAMPEATGYSGSAVAAACNKETAVAATSLAAAVAAARSSIPAAASPDAAPIPSPRGLAGLRVAPGSNASAVFTAAAAVAAAAALVGLWGVVATAG